MIKNIIFDMGNVLLKNNPDVCLDYFPSFAPLTYFDGIIVSCDVYHIKPEREIYEYMLDQYHLRTQECFFIDDRLENVEATEKLGMQGIVFDGIFPYENL